MHVVDGLREGIQMASTPYKDLGSENILSAHISGLQHDINKLQDVLELKSSEESDHEMKAVKDQDDPNLRYRIYEGTIRNWLDGPEPVIYRNGNEVDKNEYEIQPSYGVVVFHDKQSSDDEITADFESVDSVSDAITNINSDIDSNKEKISDVSGKVTKIDDRVTELEEGNGNDDGGDVPEDLENQVNENKENIKKIDGRVTDLEEKGTGDGGGSGELPDNYNILGGIYPFYTASGSYMSHQRRDANPLKQDDDGDPEYNREPFKPVFNILVYGDTIDAFPFPVTTETTFEKAGIMLGTGSDVRVKIGLYEDNGKGYPGKLVFESSTITVDEGEWGYDDIDETIKPGMYWIARHDGDQAQWNGLQGDSVIQIEKFDAEKFLRDLSEPNNPYSTNGGYRATDIEFGNMPDPFPSDVDLFKRDDYCSPWLVTK